MVSARGAVAAACVTSVAMGVSVTPSQRALYQTVPKLRLQGSGFVGDSYDVEFLPSMPAEGFKAVVSEKTLSINLAPGYEWPMQEGADNAAGSPLYVTALRASAEGPNELENGMVQVAQVIETPRVMAASDSKMIYMSGTLKLGINGTGFRQKKTMLMFDPPLEVSTDYEMLVRSSTFLQLTLKTQGHWRSDGQPGPLKVRHIDTGGGWLKIDPSEGGVKVAEVQADLAAHGVTIQSNPDLAVYQSQTSLTISGAGFDTTPSANTLVFLHSLRGKGVNYTISGGSTSSLVLSLQTGSKWRLNPETLPGSLTLLAVNAGAGFVPVGPTLSKKGRVVATVYADPSVTASSGTIYMSHTHELWIRGKGFVVGKTGFTFDPPLVANVDYYATVANSTHCRLTLVDGRRWAPTARTKLRVKGIDTGAGSFRDFTPVVVAAVEADAQDDASGISVRSSAQQRLYASSPEPLRISGDGLDCDLPDLVFDPPLQRDVDYTVTANSDQQLELELVAGRSWCDWGGPLYLKSVACEARGVVKPVALAYGQGIVVATILANPVVEVEPRRIYVTHTKRLEISGAGLTSAAAATTKIWLNPTSEDAYDLDEVDSFSIALQLKADAAWVPEDVTEETPLVVVAVDTGAGRYELDEPVVALVEPDPDGAVCDDTCEWALDGQCDDGSMDSWYYDDDDNWNYYGDDFAPEGGYGYFYYDDYGSYSAPCDLGTDCSDCNGFIGPDDAADSQVVECDNSCRYSRDGTCDDVRTTSLCQLGTDCQDCGPASASNFTPWVDDDTWWDDDHLYFTDDGIDDVARDDEVTSVGLVESMPNPKTSQKDMDEDAGTGEIFMMSLEGLVVVIGLVMCTIGSYFTYRFLKGDRTGFELLPQEDPAYDPRKKHGSVPITPDVTYSDQSLPAKAVASV